MALRRGGKPADERAPVRVRQGELRLGVHRGAVHLRRRRRLLDLPRHRRRSSAARRSAHYLVVVRRAGGLVRRRGHLVPAGRGGRSRGESRPLGHHHARGSCGSPRTPRSRRSTWRTRAALIGLVLAGRRPRPDRSSPASALWDGLASIAIGLLLLAGRRACWPAANVSLLVGQAVPRRMHNADRRRPGRRSRSSTAVPTLLTMQLGPGDMLVAAKVDFDDDVTGDDDRGGLRRGRAAAAGPLPRHPVRVPRPDARHGRAQPPRRRSRL